jgi:hypothetical protein
MPYEVAAESMRLFMKEVAPRVNVAKAA